MVLMVFLSSRISPFTSTVILRDRSPRATAVVTSAMLRTCVVRLAASRLTLSVRSFQVPPTPGTTAWPPRRPSVPTSRATRVTSAANERSCSTIVFSVSFSRRISPRTSTVIFFDKIAAGDGSGDLGDVAHLGGQVLAMKFTLSVKILPRAGDFRHLRLAAELAFRAHLARHARNLRGKGVELIHHGVDGVLELQNFALNVHGDLARQVAARHRGGYLGDVTHLAGQVAGHGVDAVGQILPRAGHARYAGLATKPAFGAHLARHARHFCGEGVELVNHRVDGLLRRRISPLHVHGDLSRQDRLWRWP